MAEYIQVYPEESVSTVAETRTRKKVVVEEIVVQKADREQQEISQPVRQRDDDWYLLLDVVPRKTAYVPPGTHTAFKWLFFIHIITPKKTILQVCQKLFKDGVYC